jgi:serine protease Do
VMSSLIVGRVKRAVILGALHAPYISAVLLILPFCASSRAADDLQAQEQAAFDAAVARVAPSVVQIETVGGLEKVEGAFWGAGPTTGLIVDPNGYILSSIFNFVHQPASILVRLPDASRRPARRVATDHARMLVLLKIDVKEPLPVCEIAPRDAMRVGQWVIALGRAFEGNQPNRAVGVLSALNRIRSRAIQTDAAVSPNNYGGPLVDIHGRVLGVLVPLSPQSADELAGSEWYDSGIGFAVPMEDIRRVLPRLKNGEDLHPGLAGIGLKGSNVYTAPPIVAVVPPKSPAAVAGLRAGDRIIEIDGRPIARAAEVQIALGRHYAGEKVRIVTLRGKDRIEREITLVEKIEGGAESGEGKGKSGK